MSAKEGGIHQRLLALLKQHPEGLTAGQMREKLGLPPHEQAQLERRRRDLYVNHDIEKIQVGRDTVYVYRGVRAEPKSIRSVNNRVRAEVLRESKGRCQMCGQTVAEDHIKLVVDHKVPLEWGGTNDEGNLWALCEACAIGKHENFLRPLDAARWLAHDGKTVEMRLLVLMLLLESHWVPAKSLKSVARAIDMTRAIRRLRERGWHLVSCRSNWKRFYKLDL